MAYNYRFPTRTMSTAAVTRLSGTVYHRSRDSSDRENVSELQDEIWGSCSETTQILCELQVRCPAKHMTRHNRRCGQTD